MSDHLFPWCCQYWHQYLDPLTHPHWKNNIPTTSEEAYFSTSSPVPVSISHLCLGVSKSEHISCLLTLPLDLLLALTNGMWVELTMWQFQAYVLRGFCGSIFHLRLWPSPWEKLPLNPSVNHPFNPGPRMDTGRTAMANQICSLRLSTQLSPTFVCQPTLGTSTDPRE